MKKILTLLACALLASCQDAPSGYVPEPFDFAAKQPIKINVAEVRVVESYQQQPTASNVEQGFATTPSAALKLWVKQRLYAVGTAGILEVAIDDASVKETKLPVTKGIKGYFTDQQDARYDMHVHVTMKLFNGTDTMSVASGDITVTRSHTLPQSATVEDHQRLYDKMTHEMIASFDQQATARLDQYFRAYLR